jgi:hypothetical protein
VVVITSWIINYNTPLIVWKSLERTSDFSSITRDQFLEASSSGVLIATEILANCVGPGARSN